MLFQNGSVRIVNKSYSVVSPFFVHVELIKEKKLHVFPLLYSSKLLLTWEEPCIVFAPHWTLRMGPVLNLLDRWHADSRCLLILEEGVDAEMVLLSFKKLAIRVLQCSFLSGIRSRKIFPLLHMLQPKLVLLPDDLRPLCTSGWNTFSLLFYSVNSTVRVPNQLKNLEGHLMTDLAFQLQPKRLASKEMAIARFCGKLILRKGNYLLVPPTKPLNLSRTRLLLWGYVDAIRLLVALKDKGLSCSIERDENAVSQGGPECVRIKVEENAVIETSTNRTLICTEDTAIAALIQEALCCACDGI
ncbi:hypothetical protein HPP92_011756 [Vanilla planifolia]|uniref:Uncharacterized protein n=1 Tax=Vanilla planifolia TaxID=51239 RepID=A0A835RCZ5_VANPL|nr:hypothetical protein HPP92_011756 [Vanilla planifolia]